jgi:hypothetical protein
VKQPRIIDQLRKVYGGSWYYRDGRWVHIDSNRTVVARIGLNDKHSAYYWEDTGAPADVCQSWRRP